jgi:cob(I)alamin adenosyltransferase
MAMRMHPHMLQPVELACRAPPVNEPMHAAHSAPAAFLLARPTARRADRAMMFVGPPDRQGQAWRAYEDRPEPV